MPVVCEFILVSLFPSEQVLVTSTAQKCELDAGVSPPVEAPVPPPRHRWTGPAPPPPPIYLSGPYGPDGSGESASSTASFSALRPPSPTSLTSPSRTTVMTKALTACHSRTPVFLWGAPSPPSFPPLLPTPHALLAALAPLTARFRKNSAPPANPMITNVCWAHS
ncbi:hypothetical protein DTO271G3_2365 [Paecilomyces variotii]|nr:hypothetical protein DTO271G3_2365 [Paecilomyces variotii]